ncbi:hypothetical protein, partial [Delftia tsuruhatensis]|uniref:hypothetical protein n=1 Tax=Delftia tsuruhatensis TaxID=180282 RepID=UPI001CB8BD41
NASGHARPPCQISLPELKPGPRVPSSCQHPQLDILATHFLPPRLSFNTHPQPHQRYDTDYFYFTGVNPLNAINAQHPSTRQQSDIQDILKKGNCHEWQPLPSGVGGVEQVLHEKPVNGLPCPAHFFSRPTEIACGF